MSSKSLTFALFGNLYQQEKSAAIQQVLACLKVHGARVIIDEEYYHFINGMRDVRSIWIRRDVASLRFRVITLRPTSLSQWVVMVPS